jgi:hypothetical protein
MFKFISIKETLFGIKMGDTRLSRQIVFDGRDHDVTVPPVIPRKNLPSLEFISQYPVADRNAFRQFLSLLPKSLFEKDKIVISEGGFRDFTSYMLREFDVFELFNSVSAPTSWERARMQLDLMFSFKARLDEKVKNEFILNAISGYPKDRSYLVGHELMFKFAYSVAFRNSAFLGAKYEMYREFGLTFPLIPVALFTPPAGALLFFTSLGPALGSLVGLGVGLMAWKHSASMVNPDHKNLSMYYGMTFKDLHEFPSHISALNPQTLFAEMLILHIYHGESIRNLDSEDPVYKADKILSEAVFDGVEYQLNPVTNMPEPMMEHGPDV